MKIIPADTLRFLRKATGHRLLNAAKITGTYLLSRLTGRASIAGLPIALSVEPTTSCNLRCPECPSGLRSFERATGMLSLDLYRKIMDELGSKLWYLILYFQGEPFLHPKFFELVRYASAKNIYTATSTNGHYLNAENIEKILDSGLDRLIISIDGTTQEVYSRYRIGGQLNKVIEGSRNLVRLKREKKKGPHIIFQFLVVQPNEHQIEAIKALAEDIGVDELRLKTAQVYDYQNGNALIPQQDRYSRYRMRKDGSWEVKNKLLNHCWKMWHSAVMTWDGKVVPCCFDKDARYRVGDIQQQNFSELWKAENYRNFRQSVLRSRSEIDICQNCTEGSRIWA